MLSGEVTFVGDISKRTQAIYKAGDALSTFVIILRDGGSLTRPRLSPGCEIPVCGRRPEQIVSRLSLININRRDQNALERRQETGKPTINWPRGFFFPKHAKKTPHIYIALEDGKEIEFGGYYDWSQSTSLHGLEIGLYIHIFIPADVWTKGLLDGRAKTSSQGLFQTREGGYKY